MTQPKIYVDSQRSRINGDETSCTGKDGSQNDSVTKSNDSKRSSMISENGKANIPLEDLNNLYENDEKGLLPNYAVEASDDELSQLTNSNSISNHADLSNESISESQLLSSHDKIDTVGKKPKKQKKRNRIGQMISGVTHKSKSELFQRLFKEKVPGEVLVSDYSCALQRDILVHGRLYLSQNWLCFYANIFGWETLVTIRWVDITAITKEKTAKLIPNAIQVFTDTDKYFFSTFVTRENAYTALFRIWQNALLGQPTLPADLKNQCRKRNSASRDAVDGIPLHDEVEETGDEMVEFDDDKSLTSNADSVATNGLDNAGLETASVYSGAGSIPYEVESLVKTHKKSASIVVNQDEKNPTITNETNSKSSDKNGTSTSSSDVKQNGSSPASPSEKSPSNLSARKKIKPKPKTMPIPSYHLKIPNGEEESTTDDNDSDEEVTAEQDDDVLCPCHDAHEGKEYVNEEFNFDVDALYEHLFSQESDMMNGIFEQRKFEKVKYTPFKREEDGSHFQILAYTIPLNYSIGPKQCHTVTKQLMQRENTVGSFYVVKTESTTLGVPYGDSFHVNTQYCITRAAGNRSRLRVTTEIKYVKKVFGLVKNMVSRATDEAFKDHINFVVNILRSESDLLSFKEVKPTKTKLTKTKSIESAKSIKRETPRQEKVVSHNKLQTTILQKKPVEESGWQVKKSSLRGFAIMFCLLFLMNVYMLSRLRALEKNILVSKENQLSNELPTTKEEWNNLLMHQKNLHELELYKLKEVIGNTAALLEQVQLSIKHLHDDIKQSIIKGRSGVKEVKEIKEDADVVIADDNDMNRKEEL